MTRRRSSLSTLAAQTGFAYDLRAQLDLRTNGATQRVVFEDVQGKSGVQLSHLGGALWSTTSAELKTSYDTIDAQLAKALGKPQWTKIPPGQSS